MIFGKAINKFYKENWYMFLIGIIAIVLIDYIQLEIPGILGGIIEGLDKETIEMNDIIESIFTIGLYVAIIMVGRFIWRMTIFTASRRFDYGLRNDMFKHCEKLSSSFYSQHKTGGLMAYFTNDLEAVRMAVGPGMIMFIDAIFLGGLALYKMGSLHVKLTLVSATPMLVIALLSSYFGKKMRNKFKEAQKAFEDISDFTNESLAGIRVIKAFVKERIELQEFRKTAHQAKVKNVEFVRIQMFFQSFVHISISLIYLVIIGYGGYILHSTSTLPEELQFTSGELTEFFMLFGSLIWPMMALARIINVRSRGKGSLQRIEAILSEEIDVLDSDSVTELETVKGNIEFKNLTFQYPDSKNPVLKNITFQIKAGETVGILGKTGSGKTSIVDLLLRIYNVNDDSIFIDGVDIMKLPIKQVRESVGYVPQDGFLFSDTISNNISLDFRKDDSHYNEIINAARLSDVHDNIIEFSDGYETVIGERGVTLSGGQRQRVSIARALIKNSPIMILDDSVSAVDTKTEETILGNLKAIRVNKTTIIIAHRISTIQNADKIIIVDDGEVVDIGTHESLLKRCALYKDMVERQRLEDEMEVQ
jgi:ATP-binding cassette subfamily B protein